MTSTDANSHTTSVEVTIDIAGQIAERTDLPKQVVAEFLADEFMKLLFT